MRRVLVILVVVVIGAGVWVGSGGAGGREVNCGSSSLGPGALVHGSKAGASCLLRSFQQHCRPATYRLSRFGVDTVSVEQFRVVSRGGRCQIAVVATFRVVPQPAHATGHGYCEAIGRRGGDIVVSGCTGTGVQATISLTARG